MPDLEIPRYDDMDTNVQWSPAFAAALVAHALLILALTFGLNWQRTSDEPVVFEAELWAELPQQQAPSVPATPSTPTPPEPVAPPAPEPEPTPPPPEPEPTPEPPVSVPDPTAVATGDIALQKAKEEQARLEAEHQAQLAREKAELERLAKEKAEKDRQQRLAQEKAQRERLAKEKAERQRLAKEKAAQAERERQARLAREQAERERIAKEKAKKAEEARQAKLAREKAERERLAKEKAEQARLEAVTQQMRNEQIQRAAGLAGSGSTQGNAAASKGPSASYGAKLVAAVKPNIIFTGRLDNNPAATVEVKTAPNGEIIGRRLVRSSGVPNWDEAVLRAVDRTGHLPLDENGSVPSPLQITFRPNN